MRFCDGFEAQFMMMYRLLLRQVMLDVQMRPGSEISLPLDPSFGVVIYILEVTPFAAPLLTEVCFARLV